MKRKVTQQGNTLVEYALILVLIAFVGVTLLGGREGTSEYLFCIFERVYNATRIEGTSYSNFCHISAELFQNYLDGP